MLLNVDRDYCIDLGRTGENLARSLTIDVSAWLSTWPDASFAVKMLRNGDDEAYPLSVSYAGNTILVPITSTETAFAGAGRLEVIAYQGNVIVKSVVWSCHVTAAIDITESGEPGEKWIDDVIQAGADAQRYASEAAGSADAAAASAAEAAQSLDAVNEKAQEIIDSTNEAAEHAAHAAEYAGQSKLYAMLSEQSAATHGFYHFEIDDDGHLIYYRTANVNDISFELVEGHLVATYEY